VKRSTKITWVVGVLFVTVIGTIGIVRGTLRVIDVLLVLALLLLLVDRVSLSGHLEDAQADIDELWENVEAIKLELTDGDQPSRGRHSHSGATAMTKVMQMPTNTIPRQ